jgi:uncharacterized protein
MRMPGLLTLILKATRECNLRCGYCNDWRSAADAMPMTVVDAFTRKALQAASVTAVHFNWHGGEPTLLPITFYEQAFARQREYCPPGRRWTNSMQSNGTLLSDEWLGFLKEHHVALGISIDGPPELHDGMRPTRGGAPSSVLVRKSLRRLAEWEVPHSVSVVASHELVEAGAAYLWSFLDELGVSTVTIIPVRPPNRPAGRVVTPTLDPQFLTVRRWNEYLLELFDLWWFSDSSVKISNFEAVIRKLLGRSSSSCLIAGGCLGSVYGVEADGTVMHCELFQAEATRTFGSILSTTFDEIGSSAQMAALQRRNGHRLDRYRGCPAFDTCSGGCPHEWYIHEAYGRIGDLTNCCGWRSVVDHVATRMAESPLAAGVPA